MPSRIRSWFIVFAFLAAALGLRAQSVSPPALQGISGGGSVELGQRVQLLVLISSSVSTTGFTFQWHKGDADIAGATAISYVIDPITPADAGTYSVTVTNSAGSSVASISLAVKDAAPPVITTQPRATVADVGQSVTFSFTATGSYPRTYQWMKNGQAIANATQASLALGPLTLDDAGAYSVKITNAQGEVTSTAAALTVNAARPPELYTSYPSDFTQVQGTQLTLQIYVMGGSSPFTYQWKKNGVEIPGATKATLTFDALTFSDAGKYSVTVTNIAGSVTSREATGVVTAATPLTITSQPQARSIYLAQSTSFSVSFNGSSPVTYQWRKNGANISGATSYSYSINSATAGDAGDYSVVITNILGTVISNPATLTVLPAVAPAITTQPQGVTIEYNGSASFSVQHSGSSPFTYQWKKDGVDVSGGTSSTLYLYNATPASNGVYSVVVTNAGGSTTSSGATLVVNPAVAPTITTQPQSQTIGYYQTIQLGVQVSGSSPLTYQWRKDGVAIPGSNSSSYYVSGATPAYNGVYSVVVTNPAGSVTSAGATVVVNAAVAPAITTQPQSQTVGYYQTVQLSVQVSGSSPLTYQWQKDGVALSSSNSSSYYISNATPANNGTYTVVVTNPAGSVTSAGATVVVTAAVAPTITTQPQSQTVGYYQSVNLSVQVSGSQPLTYQWRRDGVLLSSSNSSSYSIYSATPANSGTYTVVVSNPAGSVTSLAAAVVVNAAVAPTITTQPQSLTVGYYQTAQFSVQVSGSSPLSYQWRKDGVPIPSSTSSSLYFSNATQADNGVYSVVVTNAAGSVTSAGATLAVNAAVAPTITTQPQSQTVGYYQNAQLSVQVSGSQPLTYQWRKDGVALSGSNSSSLYLSSPTPANNGVYTVVVTNSAGSVTSAGATLTVNAAVAPTITTQPVNRTVNYYQTVDLSVQVSGSQPMSFQWRKDGVAIPSATSNSLYFYSATPANNGVYSVVITNPAGSVTSANASVVVNPAVAPAITMQPQGGSVNYYQSTQLSVQVSGSDPFTFQWRKDGVAIPSATSSTLYFSNMTGADSGVYTVVVTNPAGSVTSNGATLTVKSATAPSFARQPSASASYNYGDSINLSADVGGSGPFTMQWRKDGVAISNATSSSYYISGAKPSDNGVYTLVVTNPAGTITSNPVTIVITPPVLPKITRQPASVEVALGLSASFSIEYTATGAGPLTIQWLKNGSVIYTSTYYSSVSLNNINESDTGDYTAVITGAAGSVTSAVAHLTVLPPLPPTISSSYPYSTAANLGGYASFSVYSVSGSPPFTYQWAKNGVPIPGATSNSYSIASVAVGDYANYTVTVSNDGGVATSPPARLMLTSSYDTPVSPWLDAAKSGDIVYFLAKSPARIERYDLAGEAWLTTITLTENPAPTAFLPTAEGVYIAYGRTVARRDLNLANETVLANAPQNVTHMFAQGNYFYFSYSSTSYGRLSRANPTASAVAETATGQIFRDIAFAPSLNRGFAATYNYGYTPVARVNFAADGSLTSSDLNTAKTFGGISGVNRVTVSPDELLVFDNGGSVWRTSDGGFFASVGEALQDVAFLNDGTPVILRPNSLTAVRTDNYRESGRANLTILGWRVFARATNAFVFGPVGTTGRFSVAKLAKSDLKAATPPGSTATPEGRYSCDDAFLGEQGVVYIFSRTLMGLARWSPTTRTWLSTIPLRDCPVLASYQPGASRALFTYADGQITEVPLLAGATSERQITYLSNGLRAVTDLGDMVMFNLTNSGSSGEFRAIFGPDGEIRSTSGTIGYTSAPGVAWLASTRRLYSQQQYPTTLQYEVIPTTGVFSTTENPVPASITLNPPMRFNADGTLIATGNGRVVSPTLVGMGTLGSNFTDGAWLGTAFYSLSAASGATRVQKWAATTYLPAETRSLPGVPVRIFRLSDTQLVVVTSLSGIASFTLLNADLSVSTLPGQVAITTQPQAQSAASAGSVTLALAYSSTTAPATFAWTRNGNPIWSATSGTLKVDNLQPANTGVYVGTVTTPAGSATSTPAIVGLTSTLKVIGGGAEIGADIAHPLGNIYDQVLLQGSAATVTADAGQVVRISYVDLTDDIVQVEFSGKGALSLVLDNPSGPATAVNYNQPTVSYMKGHAGIVITGADETTNVSVFSVGKATAINQALFRSDVTYDGIADIAFLAISSSNGKFGGVRTANTNYFATKGVTGLYAPGVQFTGPVFVGDISAFDNAMPVLVIGGGDDTRITGGDLLQPNGQPVRVNGLSRLKFTDGSTSHGATVAAKANRGRLEKDGTDVTSQIVVNP